MRSLVTFSLAIALAACGGTDPGRGTKTLYVNALAFTPDGAGMTNIWSFLP